MFLENGPIPDRLRELAVEEAGALGYGDIVRLLNGEPGVMPTPRAEVWDLGAAEDAVSLTRWKEALMNDLNERIAALPNEIAANPQMADQLESLLDDTVRSKVVPVLNPLIDEGTVLNRLATPARELISAAATTPAQLRGYFRVSPIGQRTRAVVLLHAIQRNRPDLIETILAEWAGGPPRHFENLMRAAAGHPDIIALLRNPPVAQARRPSLCERVTRIIRLAWRESL
ncbi:MAG TPA: hypothetical protein VLF94_06945 [Chlamydiales bacterium]|nr:hypothetical protein [Chlamydiales bacterium]